MAGMSKEKGSGWERSACQKLSMWVTNFQQEDVFWRSAMSGGRATVRGRKAQPAAEREKLNLANQVGDISAIDPAGALLMRMFVIECKFWRDMCFGHWNFNKDAGLYTEWHKVLVRAHECGKASMMLAKQNRIGEVCMVDKLGRDLLLGTLDDPSHLTLHAHYPTRNAYVYLLKDVLTDVDFNTVRAKYAHLYGDAQAMQATTTTATIEERVRVFASEDDDE